MYCEKSYKKEVKSTLEQDLRGVCKLYTVTILLLPITTIYSSPIPSLSLGELFSFFVIVVLLFDSIMNKGLKLKQSPFIPYLLYAFVITLICGLLFSIMTERYSIHDSLERMLRDAFYFTLILLFSPYYFDFDFGITVIRKIAFISGAFILFQFIMYALFNVYIYGVIPWMTTTISGGCTGAELATRFKATANIDGFAKGTGFFSEPAVVAQFMSVALLLELFPTYGKVNYKRAIFYTVIMILTFSVNAYVAVLVCWGLWAVYSNKDGLNKLIKIILMGVILLAAFYIAMQNEKTASVLNRLVELKKGEKTSGSSVIRVIRGISFYFEMPFFFQIFGSGFGNFIQFKELFNIITVYETSSEYMNTNAYVLVSSGVIGFLLYIYALFKSSKGKVVVSLMIAFIVLMFGISSSIYSSAVYVIMLSFLCTAPRKEAVYGY